MKRALVTGGSGFLGAEVVRGLLRKGYHCRVLDRLTPAEVPTGVEFISGDVRDYETVRRSCVGIDIAFHNVGLVPLAKDSAAFKLTNVEGTRNLLRGAKSFGVSKVVFTSSSAVFGVPPSNPVRTDSPPQPLEPYGHSKLEAEKICREFAEAGMDITIIRPRTIIGPGRLGIFQILYEWLFRGQNIPVLGDGENKYQFVHVNDMAEALILAGDKNGSAVFNCGTDRFGTMREVLEDLCNYAATGSRVVSVPKAGATALLRIASSLRLSPLAPYHTLMFGESFWFDLSHTTTELGWCPKYSNQAMFRESFDWYKEHRSALPTGSSYHLSPLKQGILRLAKWLL
jgi:nucleoside-diphosphate-sugar epimerase